MKPSGIEWIGDIPDDWEVRKITTLLDNIGSGTTPPNNTDFYENGIIPWLNTGDLTDNYVDLIENKITEYALNQYSALKIFPKDSVVIAMYGATIGKLGILRESASTNQACCVMQCNDNLYFKFLFYSLYGYREYILTLSYGSGQPNISQKIIKDLRLPTPPLKTQQRIADYLDEKCGEIDATIAKQKESIEKLKAYKQSLISETVTKGLDKSAPLKPSGIEWIGNIPDDWEVTKISRLYSIQLGKMLQPEKKSSGDTYEPYICAANLSSGTFRLDEVKYMWISEPEKDIYRLKRDDLLVTEGGDVGISSIWKDDISPCYFQNALHRVVPKKGSSNRFLHYWLIVLKSVGYIDLICNKSTIAHFTKEKFAQSLILSIPLQTQEKIADYLDSKCSQIDKYITEKQNIIQKLDAYKKSLIFECVTGKKRI